MVWRYSPGMSANPTQTPSAAPSGRPVSGARDVTISASSRCDLDNSPRRTFKDGNANGGAGETEPGNFGRDTRSSKARAESSPRADAECTRIGNSRAESRTRNQCKKARNSHDEN